MSNHRAIRIVVWALALVVVFGTGVFVGGGVVYAVVRRGRALPVVRARAGDPRYRVVVVSSGEPRELTQVSSRTPFVGTVVVGVKPDSPADHAGLEVGDVIFSVDGQALVAGRDLADLLAGYQPGDKVVLELDGEGEASREVTVELGSHPEDEDKVYLGVSYRSLPWLRFAHVGPDRLDPVGTEWLPWTLALKADGGVLVVRVEGDSPASTAGLKSGDAIVAVDGEMVKDAGALKDALAGYKPGDTIVVTVYRPGDQDERDLTVTLGEDPNGEGKAYLGVWPGGSFRVMRLDDRGVRGRFGFRSGVFERDKLPGPLQFRWLPHIEDEPWLMALGNTI